MIVDTHTQKNPTQYTPGGLKSPSNDSAARNGKDDFFTCSLHQHDGVSSYCQEALCLNCTAHVLHLHVPRPCIILPY